MLADYFPKIFKGIFFLSLGALIFLLWQRNPYQDLELRSLNWPMIIVFNLAFFGLFLGLFFNWLFWLKTRAMTRRGKSSQVGVVLRQAFWLALTATIFLILQQFRALFWWDGLLVIAGMLLAEMYFLSFKNSDDSIPGL